MINNWLNDRDNWSFESILVINLCYRINSIFIIGFDIWIRDKWVLMIIFNWREIMIKEISNLNEYWIEIWLNWWNYNNNIWDINIWKEISWYWLLLLNEIEEDWEYNWQSFE